MFGPISGTVVGCTGTILYCVLTGGLNGMPGWTLGNFVIGIMLGLACKKTNNMKNHAFRYTILCSTIIIATAIGILGVKSLT
jgi:uncharacterized membrane protein